jgi:hypothetical protein
MAELASARFDRIGVHMIFLSVQLANPGVGAKNT